MGAAAMARRAQPRKRRHAGPAWGPALVGLCLAGFASWSAASEPVRLHLRAGTIDGASLPAPDPSSPAQGRFALLVVEGLLKPEHRSQLRLAGVDVVGYIPNNAFMVDLANADAEAVSNLDFVRRLVAWRPAWKLDPKLRGVTDDVPVLVHLMPGAEAADVAQAVSVLPGAVSHAEPVAIAGTRVLSISATPGALGALVNHPDVRFIEPAPAFAVRNSTTRWIVQSDTPDFTPVYDAGITGLGQVLGVMDTLVDANHCAFFDPSNPIGPDHRKILAYNANLGDQEHGTHVAGTALGDAGAFDDNRGVAYDAKLVFSFIPSAINLLGRLELHHEQGARIHSNSWGNDQTKAYDLTARSIDLFSWEHDEDLVVFSASNFDEVTNPENAKNCLAVGATQDWQEFFFGQDFHCFGGAGPTIDGRRKPEIFAPGCGTLSAATDTACDTLPLSGTSMATPAVAASAALVRQYFMDGFHPTGAANPDDALVPTGPLLKAVLINAARDMASLPISPPTYPSVEEGWGRLVLDGGLHFAGDTRRLIVRQARNNSPEALETGASVVLEVEVVTSDEPLEVTLAWHDYPAEIDAALAPVNNLDLSVTSPSGDVYKGNVFLTDVGVSVPGGEHDELNNLENVIVPSPHPGTWFVTIDATAVNMGVQGYGLAVTGDVDEFAPCPADFNADGAADVRDFADFRAAFAAGLISADVNSDGALNVFDFIAFQQVFAEGCD